MNARRNRQSAKNKTLAYIAAGLVHAAIIAALIFNFTSSPESIDAQYAEKVDVVKATTVNESDIQKQQNEIKQREREARAEKKRKERELERLKQQSEEETQRIEDLKEQQQIEQDKAEELEQQRKEIALNRKREEEKQKEEALKRKKQAEARKRKEREEAKKRAAELAAQKKELDRMRREEEEMRARRELSERLAREEAMEADRRAKQRVTSLQSKYAALIKEKVYPKITISPDFSPSLSSQMNVKLSSSGDVRVVRLIQSSGNSAYDRAVETAIYASSPLPIPSEAENSEVHRQFQNLNLNFSISDR